MIYIYMYIYIYIYIYIHVSMYIGRSILVVKTESPWIEPRKRELTPEFVCGLQYRGVSDETARARCLVAKATTLRLWSIWYTHAYTHVSHIYMYVCVCISIYLYIYLSIYMYLSISIYRYISMFTDIYVCMYVYIMWTVHFSTRGHA